LVVPQAVGISPILLTPPREGKLPVGDTVSIIGAKVSGKSRLAVTPFVEIIEKKQPGAEPRQKIGLGCYPSDGLSKQFSKNRIAFLLLKYFLSKVYVHKSHV
jgi:hypothetical protein